MMPTWRRPAGTYNTTHKTAAEISNHTPVLRLLPKVAGPVPGTHLL